MTTNQKKCENLACQAMDILRGIAMGQALGHTLLDEQRKMLQEDAAKVKQLMNEMHIAAEDIGVDAPPDVIVVRDELLDDEHQAAYQQKMQGETRK